MDFFECCTSISLQVLMGEGLKSVVMHEMGHILGLRLQILRSWAPTGSRCGAIPMPGTTSKVAPQSARNACRTGAAPGQHFFHFILQRRMHESMHCLEASASKALQSMASRRAPCCKGEVELSDPHSDREVLKVSMKDFC